MDNVFSLTAKTFIDRVRMYARQAGVKDALTLGSHVFRRGMAQDIVSQGGSLAELLRAGGWHSKASLTYLRDSQAQDQTVSQMVVNLSDSEDESE